MKLKELEELLIETKKITQEVSGVFKKTKLKDGKVVMVFIDKDNKYYIISASIEDYKRFEKWHEKEAIIDLQKTGKRARLNNNVVAPLIKLRVDFEFNNEKKEIIKNNNEIVF